MPAATEIPEQIGNYRIEARVANGQLTTVYKATSARAGVPVCIKLLNLAHVNSPEIVERFTESAKNVLGVQLSHVATVRDMGEFGGRPYIVTDLVGGLDLGLMCARGGWLRPAVAANYLGQTARGLDGVSALGVLHGDIRPSHLLMQRGNLYVIGFGRCVPWRTNQGRLVWGHPSYMAPEVPRARQPDVRTDIYSLGCTFFELLTGRPPFGIGPPDAMLACHAHEPFPSLLDQLPSMPKQFDDLLKSMGAKNPNQRPQTYREVLTAVDELVKVASAAPAEPPSLVVEMGRQEGTRVTIEEGQFLLGRTPGEGFVIDDGRISRRHAMLHRAGGKVVLEDLGSRNGVRVNGTRVRDRVSLSNGDRIGLGDTTLRVEHCEGEMEPPAVVISDVPSSPVRGAFGASEVSHPPGHQLVVDDLDQDEVVPPSVRAVAHLARKLASAVPDRSAAFDAALAAAREVIKSDAAMVVPISETGPVLDARTADEAQTLSCILPAVERALPGRLSLLTSVRVGRDSQWSCLLAPVLFGDDVETYLVLVRLEGHIERAGLLALELLADALRRPSVEAEEEDEDEPPTRAMAEVVRPSTDGGR